MSWNDRIQEAAYTSPSGVRTVFQYEDVSKKVDKKTSAFEFPDANGTFIQDLGHTGRKYPLRIFFWGENYDQVADVFETSLLESGTGKLEHPIYGAVDVVPFGTILRDDKLKTAANQAEFKITLWETIGLIYPTMQNDPASAVVSSVEEYNTTVSEGFESVVSLKTAVERATFKNSYKALLDTVSDGLQDVANAQDDVRRQFDAITDSINQGIDVLVGEPLTLAFQTVAMIQSPARALVNIEARLSAYGDLANSIIVGNNSISDNSNEFHTNDLYVSTYVTGSVVSVVNNQFVTKTEALSAADLVLQQFDDVTNWRDDNFQALDEIDTGESYQQLQEAVALAAGFLVEISFTLKQERCIVLDRDRTFVDLCAELYGETDSIYDFFINSNDLSGSEHIEIPRGREIVYYI